LMDRQLQITVRGGGGGRASRFSFGGGCLQASVCVSCGNRGYASVKGAHLVEREHLLFRCSGQMGVSKAGVPSPVLHRRLFLLLWLSIPSGFLVVFEKPNRSSFTFTYPPTPTPRRAMLRAFSLPSRRRTSLGSPPCPPRSCDWAPSSWPPCGAMVPSWRQTRASQRHPSGSWGPPWPAAWCR
jgi:hypothetical protein